MGKLIKLGEQSTGDYGQQGKNGTVSTGILN